MTWKHFMHFVLVTLLVAVLSTYVITGQNAMTEKAYKKCINDANKQFATLTKNIYKSDSFYGTINNLKCRYVSKYFVRILKLNLVWFVS